MSKVHCVLPNSPAVKELAASLGIHPAHAAVKVALWQDVNGLEKFPVKEDFLVPVTIQEESRNTEAFTKARSIASALSKRFGIRYNIDTTLSTPGAFLNGKVIINPDKVAPDTVLHEFAHPFEQAIKQQNKPLWNRLVSRASTFRYKSQSIEDYVKQLYPELSGDDLKSEIIVTAIGLAATDPANFTEEKSLLQRFIDLFIKSVRSYIHELRKNVNREINASDIHINAKISDLAEMMRLENPVNLQGVNLSEGYQKGSAAMPTGEGLKELKAIASEFILDETDPDNTFYKKGTAILERATEFIAKAFSSQEKQKRLQKKTVPQWLADKYFKAKQVSTSDKVVWDKTGNEVTYDEAVELFRKDLDESNAKAKVIHAIVEMRTARTSAEKAAAKDKVAKLKADNKLEDKWFSYLTQEYLDALLIDRLNLNIRVRDVGTNLEDITASEVTLGWEELGIAGTLDMLVEHPNKSFSIIDIKTGKLLSDVKTIEEMRFAEVINDIMKDTKLNKAQMQVMMYAFLLKLNKPDAKFEKLQIVHLQGKDVNKADIYNVSIENYLQLIENYVKAERPELYDKYKDKGLFDYENYIGQSKNMFRMEENNATFKNMTKEQQIDYLTNLIAAIEAKKNQAGLDYYPPEMKAKLIEYNEMLNSIIRENKKEVHADQQDMSTMKRWIGNLYEVSNPLVQSFLQLFQRQKLAAKREYDALKHMNDKLMSAVLTEYKEKRGPRLNPVYHSDDGTGLYDFMWEQTAIGDTNGWYARIITEDDVKNGKYSKAQYEYNKWYREKVMELYTRTMRTPIEAGSKITKESIWGGDKSMIHDRMMPRIPMSREDLIEQKGLFSKENFASALENLTTTFLKDERIGHNDAGLPVKYVGSSGIISSANHSFDAQKALLKFSQAMINKHYLDAVEAVGNSTILFLKQSKDVKTNQLKYKNLIAWTESFINNQLIRDSEDISLSRKPQKYKLFGKEYEVDYINLLKGSNTLVSASAMWLSVAGATFNGIMNGLYMTSKAVQGSILKHFGKGYNYDYSLSDFFNAAWEYFGSGIFNVNNYVSGDKKIINNSKDKMHRFIELLDYDTNTFRNVIGKENLLAAKNRLLDSGKLYFMHSISEEFALYTTMIALLKNHKLQDGKGQWIKMQDGKHVVVPSKSEASSMWDAYDIDADGQFVYNGPVRGKLLSGSELTELTTEEIIRMRRISQRMYGSYREDEKCAIEGYVLGQLFMKFKKYLPNVLTFNFQAAFDDESLGSFVPYKEGGIPAVDENGLTIYQWQSKVNEGRVRTIFKIIQATAMMKMSSDPKYRNYYENLSDEQRKVFVDGIVTTLLCFGLIAFGAMFFDDDKDKDKKWYKRYQRLHEDIIGINPFDLARTGQQGFLQAQMAYKTMDASWNFFYRGLIKGEVNKSGKYKGDKPGAHYLKTKVPLLNIANQFGLIDDDEDFFLNRR